MNCVIEEIEEHHEDDTKVISSLSELIYPEMHQQPPTTLRPIEIETESSYLDESELSAPIDISTDHDELYHEEENEIPDDTEDIDSEFIQHETEPLLQDLANQMMHLIEESSTATVASVDDVNEEETTTAAEMLSEGHDEDDEKITTTESAEEKLEIAQTEANKKQTDELIDGRVDETKIVTEKLVGETESSTPFPSSSEPSSITESIVDSTTQAIVELTSRTSIMEPNAEVSSTIVNFIHEDTLASTTMTSIESTTKDTRRELNFSHLLNICETENFFHTQKKYIELNWIILEFRWDTNVRLANNVNSQIHIPSVAMIEFVNVKRRKLPLSHSIVRHERRDVLREHSNVDHQEFASLGSLFVMADLTVV